MAYRILAPMVSSLMPHSHSWGSTMTQQTDLERDEAHVADTISLLKDVIEANKIPENVAICAAFGILFEYTLKKSSNSVLAYIIKFDDLLKIFSKASAGFMRDNMANGKLKL